jgi:hypothetical protein
MALIVEDGSLVANANSYITLAEYKAWADARGLAYSANDATIEQQILRAMDYLERIFYIGNKANENQFLQWPRTEAQIDGYYADATEIPKEVKTSTYEATKVQADGYSQFETEARRTKSESIGDISVVYADNSENRTTTPALTFALSKIIQPAGMVSRV